MQAYYIGVLGNIVLIYDDNYLDQVPDSVSDGLDDFKQSIGGLFSTSKKLKADKDISLDNIIQLPDGTQVVDYT